MTETPVRFVTNSEKQTFQDCRRRWYLAYHRGLAPRKEREHGPLPLGTRVHAGLEALYLGEDPIEVYEAYASVSRERLDPEFDDVKKFESEVELGRIMLAGYLDWLAEEGADDGLEVIAPEESVAASLDRVDGDDRPVHLLGKLDLRVRRELDGAVLFMDHKTAQSFARVFETLAINEQFLTYQLLDRLNLIQAGSDSPPATGSLVNVLRKVKRTATAKPPFYRREEIHHGDVELRNFWRRIHSVVTDMLQVEARLAAGEDHLTACPPRQSVDCTWRCAFHKVCHLFDDGSHAEEALEAHYVPRDPLLRYRQDNRHDIGQTEEE